MLLRERIFLTWNNVLFLTACQGHCHSHTLSQGLAHFFLQLLFVIVMFNVYEVAHISSHLCHVIQEICIMVCWKAKAVNWRGNVFGFLQISQLIFKLFFILIWALTISEEDYRDSRTSWHGLNFILNVSVTNVEISASSDILAVHLIFKRIHWCVGSWMELMTVENQVYKFEGIFFFGFSKYWVCKL